MTAKQKDKLLIRIRDEFPQMRTFRFQVWDGWNGIKHKNHTAVRVMVTNPYSLNSYEAIKTYDERSPTKTMTNAIWEAFDEIALRVPGENLEDYLKLI